MLGAHARWVWGGKNINPPLKKLVNSESPGFESPLPALLAQGPPGFLSLRELVIISRQHPKHTRIKTSSL